VPDERLKKLAETIEKEEKLSPGSVPLKPATIEFVDIAGLVKGAAEGEGLGNRFLAHIRETDLICHVLRAFPDPDVVVTGELDPVEDLNTVRSELALKDLETVSKQEKEVKSLRSQEVMRTYEKALQTLDQGRMISSVEWAEKEENWLKGLHLLTAKPEVFVINVGEEQLTQLLASSPSVVEAGFQLPGVPEEDVVYISAKVESELAVLSDQDEKDYLADLGLSQSGIERMAKIAYRKLNLISFLTAGVVEARAWAIKKDVSAQEAAEVIHTDFADKFIKAKICKFEDFVRLGGWKAAAEAGKVRQEGREYEIEDGDVVEFMVGK